MSAAHLSPARHSIFRWAVAAAVLVVSLGVSFSPRGALVKADSGEAPYGTSTQSLESAISLGTTNTCVITNGNLLCWGENNWGKLGNGQSGTNKTAPGYVMDSAANPTTRLSGVIGVATADNHTCAIVTGGKVKCWGYIGGNLLGRYASFSNSQQNYPDFVKDSFTDATTLAASADLVNATQIAIGTYGSCALISDGKVKCWGQNPGHAGSGVGYVTACTTPSTTGACSATTGVPIDHVTQITKSGDTSCAIRDDGSMLCWGSDGGLFGNPGQSTLSPYPKNAGSATYGAKAIGNGQYSQCGIYENPGTNIDQVGGTVKCWGQNNSGELGRNSTSADPGGVEAVVGITNAIAIAGQERSYCALLIDTKVKCWGGNSAGMFSSDQASFSAMRVPYYMLSDVANNIPLTGVAALSVGTMHVCVIMQSNGAVKCSGSNTQGQLGDGTIVAKSVGTNVVAGETCASNCGTRTLTGTGGEFMPPVFVSAEVNTAGTKIVLTYEKALTTSPLPLASSFDVVVDGVTRTVSSVSVVGSTVELTFASAISRALAVSITYTDPTTSNDTVAIQDLAGNDAATVTAVSVTNNSTVDLVAPLLVSGAVNTAGTQLILTYDEALNSTTAAASRFTLTVAGRTKTISSTSVSGSTVVLSVANPVIQTGQTVTIAYSAITSDSAATNLAVQDTAGNDAASFLDSALVVTNSSTAPNTAPSLVTQVVNSTGTKIILTFDEALAAAVPAGTAFTVTVGGVSRTVSGVVRGTDTTTLELTLASAITEGQVVTMAYTAPTVNDASATNNAIQDLVGKDSASITATSVTNTIDNTAPTFVSGAVNSGGSLVLTYSETLASPAPDASSMVVTINGTTVTVVSATLVGSTVVVVTSPVIGIGDVVTFRYTDPTSGNDANAIQDAAGNDVASSSSTYTVPGSSNASTVDTDPPGGTSIAVDSGGTQVTITFDESLSSTGPATSTLTVTVDGVNYTITNVRISGRDAILTVSPTIRSGQTVVVSYRDPTSGNDTNALQDLVGNDSPAFTNVTARNGSTQVSAVTQVSTLEDTTLTVDGDAATTDPSLTQTVILKGKSGKATFADGSTFTVSKNGNLIPKLFTAYIGYVTGSVKVTYLSGKKMVSSTCSYGKYGTKKPRKVTKSQNGWYPKAFISPTKSCKMPPAALKALNTSLVTIAAKLKFARLWPTTGLPKNPESGAAVNPVKRSYSVKIGTAP